MFRLRAGDRMETPFKNALRHANQNLNIFI